MLSKDDSELKTATSRLDEIREKLLDAYRETENVRRNNAQLEIYLKKYPEKAQELLQYMNII